MSWRQAEWAFTVEVRAVIESISLANHAPVGLLWTECRPFLSTQDVSIFQGMDSALLNIDIQGHFDHFVIQKGRMCPNHAHKATASLHQSPSLQAASKPSSARPLLDSGLDPLPVLAVQIQH